ncbi:MAG: serine/threonine protein kinase [Myxococcales bacterium]|nr:serine/threonine protein kinase [Myxococcales bacterium]
MELQRLGTYRLVRHLPTRGAASRIFLARHDDEPDEGPPSFFIKLLIPGRGEAHEHLQAQFEHEIRLLRAFNHPAIPTAHADGEQDGVRYVVMDHIDGVDLAALLGHREGAPRALPRELCVYIMGQLADALRYAHGFAAVGEEDDAEEEPLGLVHRDIAPSNVVLSRHGDVMLVDFNSARSAWLDPAHDMVDAGQKAYTAPERIIGTTPATPRSDLFSMAVILWEMLRGQRCFKAESDLKTMDAIVCFDISHASRRISGLSTKLGEILRKNLDRDPSRRYTGAYQMLQRLAQAPEAAAAERSREQLAAMVRETADRLSKHRSS